VTRLDVLHRAKRKDDKIFTHEGHVRRIKDGRRVSNPSRQAFDIFRWRTWIRKAAW